MSVDVRRWKISVPIRDAFPSKTCLTVVMSTDIVFMNTNRTYLPEGAPGGGRPGSYCPDDRCPGGFRWAQANNSTTVRWHSRSRFGRREYLPGRDRCILVRHLVTRLLSFQGANATGQSPIARQEHLFAIYYYCITLCQAATLPEIHIALHL